MTELQTPFKETPHARSSKLLDQVSASRSGQAAYLRSLQNETPAPVMTLKDVLLSTPMRPTITANQSQRGTQSIKGSRPSSNIGVRAKTAGDFNAGNSEVSRYRKSKYIAPDKTPQAPQIMSTTLSGQRNLSHAQLKTFDAVSSSKNRDFAQGNLCQSVQKLHLSTQMSLKPTESRPEMFTLGIDGYQVVKYGVAKSQVEYSVMKEKNKTFLDKVVKHAKANPCPTKYSRQMSWNTSNGRFGIGAARLTFTDEAQKQSKKIPSSQQYFKEEEKRILLGCQNKAEDIDYLTDCMYVGKMMPGPGTYKPNKDFVKNRTPSAMIVQPLVERKGWKPIKSKLPGPDTYDFSKGKSFVSKQAQSITLTKETKTTFTSMAARNKKWVPGIGSYNPDKCIDKVSIPYSRKRI